MDLSTTFDRLTTNRQELQRMLHLNRKAEIQVILSADPSLVTSISPRVASAAADDIVEHTSRNMLVDYIHHRLRSVRP